MDQELLNILVCPVCQGQIQQQSERSLICLGCQRCYSIENQIPVMLVDEDGCPGHV